MSRQLLKEFIRALIFEAAMPVASAQQQGLALFIKQSGGNTKFVMYDPAFYREFIVVQQNSIVDAFDEIVKGIWAFFSANPGSQGSCEGAWEVYLSSAKGKYGPMMYDIVMSYSNAPIMPDRNLVTPKARSIWNFYSTRSDVEKIPLSPEGCKTYEDPEEEILNFAYKVRQPVNFSGLTNKHQEFMRELGNRAKEFEVALLNAGPKFFDEVISS